MNLAHVANASCAFFGHTAFNQTFLGQSDNQGPRCFSCLANLRCWSLCRARYCRFKHLSSRNKAEKSHQQIQKQTNVLLLPACQLYIYMLIRFHPCGTFNDWMLSFLEDTGHCKLYPIKLGKVFTRITTLQLHLLQTLTNCRSSWSSAIGVNDALLKPISATGASKCQ